MKFDTRGHGEQKVWIPSAGTASAAVLAAVCGQPIVAAVFAGAAAVMAGAIAVAAHSERRASTERVRRYLARGERQRPSLKDQVHMVIADLDETARPKTPRKPSAWTDRIRRLGTELKAERAAPPALARRRFSTSRRLRREIEDALDEEPSAQD